MCGARLLESIPVNDGVSVPAGSLFEGRVVRRIPPHRFNRPGLVHLRFYRLILPTGSATDIATSLGSVELETTGLLKVDREGTLRGASYDKRHLVLRLGSSYLTGKIADDLLEAGLNVGTSAVASGTATALSRYVGIGAGLLFTCLRRASDVRLPKYAELEITFVRPVMISPQ